MVTERDRLCSLEVGISGEKNTSLGLGTVEEDLEITAWRASIGFGMRIQVDFLGPIPFVLDFGFPIADQREDNTQVFNFSLGASF